MVLSPHFSPYHFSASKSPEFRGVTLTMTLYFSNGFRRQSTISTPVVILTSIYTVVPVQSSEPFLAKHPGQS
jgi:hypothetical protein